MRSPDQLGPDHIREYEAYLFRERKLAARTVRQRLAALRFFFIQTIKKVWSVADGKSSGFRGQRQCLKNPGHAEQTFDPVPA